jgi:phage-related minor tail protein
MDKKNNLSFLRQMNDLANENAKLEIQKLSYAFDTLMQRYELALRMSSLSNSNISHQLSRFYEILDDALGGIHALEKELRKEKTNDKDC